MQVDVLNRYTEQILKLTWIYLLKKKILIESTTPHINNNKTPCMQRTTNRISNCKDNPLPLFKGSFLETVMRQKSFCFWLYHLLDREADKCFRFVLNESQTVILCFGKKLAAKYTLCHIPVLVATSLITKMCIHHSMLNKAHHCVSEQSLIWTNWGNFVSMNCILRLVSFKLLQLIKRSKSEDMH